jgi:hypothetical protein
MMCESLTGLRQPLGILSNRLRGSSRCRKDPACQVKVHIKNIMNKLRAGATETQTAGFCTLEVYLEEWPIARDVSSTF